MLIHKMHVDTRSSTAIVRVRAYGKNTSFRNRKIHLRFSPPAARPVEVVAGKLKRAITLTVLYRNC